MVDRGQEDLLAFIDSNRVFYPLTRIPGFGSSSLTISKGSPLNKWGTGFYSVPPKSHRNPVVVSGPDPNLSSSPWLGMGQGQGSPRFPFSVEGEASWWKSWLPAGKTTYSNLPWYGQRNLSRTGEMGGPFCKCFGFFLLGVLVMLSFWS